MSSRVSRSPKIFTFSESSVRSSAVLPNSWRFQNSSYWAITRLIAASSLGRSLALEVWTSASGESSMMREKAMAPRFMAVLLDVIRQPHARAGLAAVGRLVLGGANQFTDGIPNIGAFVDGPDY